MKIDTNIALKLAEKVKMVMGREILVTNENGFLLNNRRGEFQGVAFRAVKEGDRKIDSDTGYVWVPIFFEDKAFGAFGIDSKNISEESLELCKSLSEVLIYQELLIRNLFSVTDIRTNFIKDLLLTENIKDMREAIPQADVLKINLRAPQAVILIYIRDFASSFLKNHINLNEEEKKIELIKHAQEIELLIKKAFKDFDQNVVIYFSNDTFVVLKGIGERKLSEEKNISKFMKQKVKYLQGILRKSFKSHKITFGIGQYYPELNGLRKSFQDAVLALDIGMKVWGEGKIYHILDVGTFVSLSGDITYERKSEIAAQVLKPLLEDRDLLRTVQVFLSSGMNLTKAARDLHVHRNTLIYRLNKIKRMIGLDPKRFYDALQIKLGFMMRSLG